VSIGVIAVLIWIGFAAHRRRTASESMIRKRNTWSGVDLTCDH